MSRLKKIANQFDSNDIRNDLDPIIAKLFKIAADEFIYDKIGKGEAEENDIDGFLNETANNPNIEDYLSYGLPSEVEGKINESVKSLENLYSYFLSDLMEKEFQDYKNK